MEMLVGCTQEKIKAVMSHYLKEKYTNIIETQDYIVAIGDIPIALVAHMDTVFEAEIRARGEQNPLLYDKQKNIMHCVGYGGFDDKAGVFAIIQILQAGLRPHIILTTDEEKGCVGAGALARIPCPFEDCRYLIELDRRGAQDCVFYDMDTTTCADFVQYVEQFGFVENYGTFSDISEICPAWGVAVVNLSVGYYNEHTSREILYVDVLLATITKVKAMLKQSDIPTTFKYVENYYGWKRVYGWGGYGCDYDDYNYNSIMKPTVASALKNSKQTYTCAGCHKNHFLESEMFPVITKDGKTKFYCGDCLIGKVNWCTKCWEAYEIDKAHGEKEDPNYICPTCKQAWGKIKK